MTESWRGSLRKEAHDLSDIDEDEAILRIAAWCEEHADSVAEVVINRENEMVNRYVQKLVGLSCRVIDVTPGLNPRTYVIRAQWGAQQN